MGCFDYICECGGNKCDHIGGQFVSSLVIIEVNLSDNTTVFLKGFYEQYGYVLVNEYKFYPEQFEDLLEEGSYRAGRIWTYEQYDRYEDEPVLTNCFGGINITELTPEIIKKL
jgi:hypothetical protein